jgi:hypothetical protein
VGVGWFVQAGLTVKEIRRQAGLTVKEIRRRQREATLDQPSGLDREQ